MVVEGLQLRPQRRNRLLHLRGAWIWARKVRARWTARARVEMVLVAVATAMVAIILMKICFKTF